MRGFERPLAGWILRLSIVSFTAGAIVGVIGTQNFHAKATAGVLRGIVTSAHAPVSKGEYTSSREHGEDGAPRSRDLLLLLEYAAQSPFGRLK